MEEAIDYYKDAIIEKYADFEGRARRSEFWYFYLIHMLIILGLAIAAPRISFSFYAAIIGLYTIATIIPTLSITVRRLHDIDKSGWWYLISLIPLVGGIILIVFLATEGTYGPNLYGPDPIEEEELLLEENY